VVQSVPDQRVEVNGIGVRVWLGNATPTAQKKSYSQQQLQAFSQARQSPWNPRPFE
jgi:hypothetical protein